MKTSITEAFSLDEIIAAARSQAPFYRRLYAGLPEKPALSELPVVDQAQYWEAHALGREEVLTGPLLDGMVLKSGGTTGAPKHSYYSNKECDLSLAIPVRSFEGAGLQDGDRVATLFFAGSMYASLLFATEALRIARVRVVQFPIGFSPNVAEAAEGIRAFHINVLAGFPTHLMRLIEYMDAEEFARVHIDRIVYAGELFSRDQHDFLQKRFPGVRVHSAGYASVDAGPIAYADAECAIGEHRVYDGVTIVEILDEATDQPINEVGKPGRVIFTSLARLLMPVIRYPSGDRAQWVDAPGVADRKFLLLGRSEEAARVGSNNVSVSAFRALLASLPVPVPIHGFQLVVRRVNLRDKLIVRIAGEGPQEVLEEASKHILIAFTERWPEIYADAVQDIVRMPEIEWVKLSDLTVSPRTGKLLSVVDNRLG